MRRNILLTFFLAWCRGMVENYDQLLEMLDTANDFYAKSIVLKVLD